MQDHQVNTKISFKEKELLKRVKSEYDIDQSKFLRSLIKNFAKYQLILIQLGIDINSDFCSNIVKQGKNNFKKTVEIEWDSIKVKQKWKKVL